MNKSAGCINMFFANEVPYKLDSKSDLWKIHSVSYDPWQRQEFKKQCLHHVGSQIQKKALISDRANCDQ